MTILTADMKEGIQKLYEKLSSPEALANPAGPTKAVAKMTGPQASEAIWPTFKVLSDEPESVGGTSKAPPPSSIFVASIGFAENVIFARTAALNGVEFDSLETSLEAHWDRRGMFGISDVDPSITRLHIETKITTDAPPEKVAEILRLNDKRCSMTATVAKSAAIERTLYVNGQETPV